MKVLMVHVLGRPRVYLLVSVSILVCDAMVDEAYDAMVCGPMVGEVCVGMSWRQSESFYPMIPS